MTGKRILGAGLLVALLGTFSACGFHRQGVAAMPEVMRVTYVDSKDERTEFQLGLRRALEASGATLAAKREEATATLRILRDETGQRVLSVSARNTPREYEVFYTVEFSVTGKSGELLPPQKLTLTRDYSFDEQALLAKEREEEVLREALARDLVGIVLRRLASL
jgi:LPS-assembly lipoprotein